MRALTLRPPTDQEWNVINKLAASRTAPAAQVRRAQLLKHLVRGVSAPQAAALVGGLTAETARNVLKSFNQAGLKVLEDKPPSGRPPQISEVERGRLVMLAQSQPPEGLAESSGACHWTLDTLLAAAHREGIPIGRTHLWEVLNQEGVRWWRRSRSWLVSTDPELPQKRGTLWASTPTLRRGQWAESSHRPHYQPDYGRRGYLWLYGALNPHTGQGYLYQGEHRDSRNFTAFMDEVAQWIPEGAVHLVIDNLSIHSSVDTLLWNFGHSRFYFHFLPTGAAWLNLIEGWWNILGHRALDGRDFKDTRELGGAFSSALKGWNAASIPFCWNPQERHRRRGKCLRCARLHRHHGTSLYTKVVGE